jgi:hypothetical protein
MSARQRRRRADRRQEHSSSRPTRKRLIAAGGLTAGATLAMAGTAQAAPQTYTVGTDADASSGGACTTPTNSNCSLREAIGLANANAGSDTIVFNSNLTGATIDPSTSGQLAIHDGVTITGPGASQLTIDPQGVDRIFYVDPATADDPVSISGMTLTNPAGSGGGVYNVDATLNISDAVVSYGQAYGGRGAGISTYEGRVAINRSTITANYAMQGGGIFSDSGRVTITESTVSGNTVGPNDIGHTNAYGGGVYTYDGDVYVTRSTVSGNQARDGGGIYSANGNVVLQDATVALNRATSDGGGGVWVDAGSLTVVSSTVTGNTAGTTAGGLQSYTHHNQVIRNSIISGNTAAADHATDDLDANGYLFNTSFSLIKVPGGVVNTTVPSSNLLGVNPQLGPLQDNGGPTGTRKPLSTSPVIDCGVDTVNSTDQRGAGFPRVVNQPNRTGSTASGANNADMGAVEVSANPAITGTCANSPPPPPPPTPTPTPTTSTTVPTGERAAGLTRCKRKYKQAVKKKKANDALTKPLKKQLKKKLRKCKRRANQLPV